MASAMTEQAMMGHKNGPARVIHSMGTQTPRKTILKPPYYIALSMECRARRDENRRRSGGNALPRRGEPQTVANQRRNVEAAVEALAPLASSSRSSGTGSRGTNR